jgi:hypothetical protein
MPAVAAILRYGNLPSASLSLKDEQNATTPEILVQSLTTSATREEKEYRNSDGNVFALEYRNPTISFAFDGYITTKTGPGLSNLEPGQRVFNLANFTVSTFGFSPTDGVMIYMDPSRSETNEEIAKATFTVKQYPFVVA